MTQIPSSWNAACPRALYALAALPGSGGVSMSVETHGRELAGGINGRERGFAAFMSGVAPATDKTQQTKGADKRDLSGPYPWRPPEH